MKTIWKFKLEIMDFQWVSMPKDAKILTVQTQFTGDAINPFEPFIWALVESDNETELRTIRTFGTGRSCESNNKKVCDYINTYQLSNGLVFHVFEEL